MVVCSEHRLDWVTSLTVSAPICLGRAQRLHFLCFGRIEAMAKKPGAPPRLTAEDLAFIMPVVKAPVQAQQDALAAANNRDRRGRRLPFKRPSLRMVRK